MLNLINRYLFKIEMDYGLGCVTVATTFSLVLFWPVGLFDLLCQIYAVYSYLILKCLDTVDETKDGKTFLEYQKDRNQVRRLTRQAQ